MEMTEESILCTIDERQKKKNDWNLGHSNVNNNFEELLEKKNGIK